MNVRPFALLASATVAAVGSRISFVIGEWCADWGIDRASTTVESHRAWESTASLDAEWRLLVPEAGGQVKLATYPALEDEVKRCLFTPGHRFRESACGSATSIASEAAQAAIDDMAARLAAVFGCVPGGAMESAQPSAAALACGSGAVIVSIGIGKSGWCMLADYAAVLIAAPQDEWPKVDMVRPSNRAVLLDGLPVSLPVVAGRTEVAIGNLLTLAVGDVIRLDARVDEPLPILSPDGKTICMGYLHAMDQRVVVEIVRLDQ